MIAIAETVSFNEPLVKHMSNTFFTNISRELKNKKLYGCTLHEKMEKTRWQTWRIYLDWCSSMKNGRI